MSRSFPLRFLKLIFSVLLFSVIIIPAYPNVLQNQDTIVHKSVTHEDLVRGERLFHGLVYPENKSITCIGCHNIKFSDTLNWNPNAIEISQKYLGKSEEDLSKVLLNPTGIRMAEVHKGFQVTPEEITLLKIYMDELTISGMQQQKPVITNLLLFIIASIFMLGSLVDLMITKRIKKIWLHMGILTITGVYITWRLVVDAIAVGHSPGYGPDQPVKFSHAVHAGQNRTDCVYCHSYAPFSKSSGFPATNVCMNCHLIVRTGKLTGAFEIAKVIDSYEQMKPIQWIRVHNLPDHAFFSHAQHVGAGGVSCQECHGPVQEMGRITLNDEMTMGWCINCHRTRNVNFNNNKFYSQYTDMAEKIRNGETANVTVEMLGGTECMKCHY